MRFGTPGCATSTLFSVGPQEADDPFHESNEGRNLRDARGSVAFRVPADRLRASLACPSEPCSASEAGSHLRLIDSCFTQLQAHGTSKTCEGSKHEEGQSQRTGYEPFPNPSWVSGLCGQIKMQGCEASNANSLNGQGLGCSDSCHALSKAWPPNGAHVRTECGSSPPRAKGLHR